MAGGNEELLYTNGVFEYQNRPKRDVGWAVFYWLFLAATAVFGVYGILHRCVIANHNCKIAM